MTFFQLKELLGRATNKWGMQRSVTASMVCNRYREHAPTVVHEQILDFSKPRYFKDGILTVYVENSAWAQELFLNKGALQKLINDELGNDVVKDFRITVEKS